VNAAAILNIKTYEALKTGYSTKIFPNLTL